MMRTTRLLGVACAFLVAGLLTACGHKAPVTQPSPPPPPAAVVQPPPPPPAPLIEAQIFARKTLDELNAEAPLKDAFFDYDKAAIGTDAAAQLTADAKWLSRWPTVKVRVEGHCDERGTAEYNLALGERRAAAVVSYLESLGISGGRMTPVSYGKERPACTEATESCWQRNRRGHLVITTK
jgi:peptidoglycan-associated lipoprotein